MSTEDLDDVLNDWQRARALADERIADWRAAANRAAALAKGANEALSALDVVQRQMHAAMKAENEAWEAVEALR